MVNELFDDLCENYKIDKQRPPEEEWPPHQPSSIVNLALIHYNNRQTKQELIEISKRCKEGASYVDNLAASHSNVTTNIHKIFMPKEDSKAPKRILIEGAPGIGKTILAREIVYKWANGEILNEHKLLFLLYLRDPRLYEVKSVNQILNLFASENTRDLQKYVKKSGGKNVAFVFDGFDEYPVALQGESYITALIKGVNDGKLFYNSTVVVTSRPAATLFLHNKVDRRIEILGFPKEERDKYVSLSLNNSLNEEQFYKYLEQHPIIDNLCYIPLYLTILMYLFQQDSLPRTLTKMNESFIINTIYRYLERNKLTPPGVVNKLQDLPNVIREFIYKLSQLAFEGLRNNKLVFTLDEIKTICPEVDSIPEVINGFGLLQAVQHYPKKGAGRTTSVNFLHFTMQEYLAALHVSRLPHYLQLEQMKQIFWDSQFNFMWMMYVGIVGIESYAFARFIAQNHNDSYTRKPFFDIRNMDTKFPEMESITSDPRVYHFLHTDDQFSMHNTAKLSSQADVEIYKDKRKCLHLFQCYMEAGSDAEIPKEVSSVFTDGKIILNNVTLLPHHISSLIFFMSASSMQEWKILKMQRCNLGDVGMNRLLEHIIKNKENISTLMYVDLSVNNSSPWGVYSVIIRHCCVSSLTLCGDEGMKKYVKDITDSLQMNTILQSLTLCNIKSTSTLLVIKDLLINNTRSKELNLSWNRVNLSRNRVDARIICGKLTVSTALDNSYNNTELNLSNSTRFSDLFDNQVGNIILQLMRGLHMVTLQRLIIPVSSITDDGAIAISECLKYNSTLRVLDLAYNSIDLIGMNNLSKYIQHIPLEYVDLSKNYSSPWGVYCTIIRHCSVDSVMLCGDDGMEKHVKEMTECLQTNFKLQSLTLCKIRQSGLQLIKDVLTLKEMNVAWKSKETKIINGKFKRTRLGFNTHEQAVVDINILYDGDHECSPEVIDMSNKDINDDTVCLISFGLHNNATVKKLDLSCNNITFDGMNRLLECTKHFVIFQYVDLSENRSSPWGVYCAIIRHCCVDSLSLFGDKGMNEYVKEIANSLQTNPKLQSLTLCKIGQIGLKSIENFLSDNATLKELNVSWKNKGTKIVHRQMTNGKFNKDFNTNEQVVDINILYDGSHECSPEVIDLSNRDISDDAMCLISFGLHNNATLKKLDLSCNKITYDGMNRLLECTKHLVVLRYVDLSKNRSSPWGVYCAIIRHCCVDSLSLCGDKGMNEYVERIADSLQANPKVMSLTLYKIKKIGFLSIKGVLNVITTLKELNVTWKSKGTKIIHRQLTIGDKFNSTRLDCITHDKVVNINIMYDGDHKCSPEIIDMSDKDIDDDAVSLISFGLHNNATVKKLDLSCNNITFDGMNRLLECIKHPAVYQYVNLSGNRSSPWGVYCAIIRHCSVDSLILCGDDGMEKHVKEMTESLKTNFKLQSLTLCKIRQSGLQLIKDVSTLKEMNVAWKSKGTKIINGKFKRTRLGFDTHEQVVVDINILYDDDHECSSEVIDMSNKDINDDTVCLISFGLHNNTAVKKFDLSCNNITFDGMSRLLECTKHFVIFQYVDLSENRSSPWGVYCAIIRHCCVDSLTLCGDEGMGEYVEEIANSLQKNPKLQSLTLCKIGQIGLKSIEKILSDNTFLKELNVSWKSKGTKIIHRQMMNGKFNKDFNTNGQVVDINILYDGSHECSPEVIDLSNRDISDDAMCLISFGLHNSPTLKKLDLSFNKITYDGMNRLLECSKHLVVLRYVDLSKNRSSPWGVYCAIIRHCCVDSLTLCGDKGMNEYVERIADSLQANPKVMSLTLYKIKKIGFLSIKGVLNVITTLKELNVSWKSKGTKIIHRQLTIGGNFNSTRLDCITHDKVVNINIMYDGDHKCSPEIIDMSDKDIDDDAVSLISFGLHSNVTVKKLDLSCNNITFDGMNRLLECIKHPVVLQCVDLSENRSSPWGVYCAVIRHCSVDSLTLCGHEGIKQYVKEIIDSLQINTALHSLILSSSRSKLDRYKDIRLQSVSGVNGKLCFNTPSNDNRNIIFLDSNDRIVDVKVLYDGDSECLPGSINLSRKGIADNTLCLISFGLYNNTTVKKLDISYNKITDEGVLTFSDCFWSCSIHTLILSGNSISYKGAMKIAEIIAKKAIQNLDISRNDICNEGVKAISECLKTNNILQELNISNNWITSEGAKTVAEAIMVNKSLHKLDISQNFICDDGVMYISNSLKCNDGLLELNLSKSSITNKGLKYISEAIQANGILQKLDLSHNHISDDGIITNCLQFNNAIIKLNLLNTSISEDGLKFISETLNSRQVMNKDLSLLMTFPASQACANSQRKRATVLLESCQYASQSLKKQAIPEVYKRDK